MAKRRMFNKEIVESDKFIDMPLSSQALFFHLGMSADDDGFVSSPKRIQRSIGCSEDDIKILIAKNFIIAFESGVVVVNDWIMHNQIRKDRYTPTIHKSEKHKMQLIENKECQPNGNQMATIGIPSIVEVSIDKVSIEENIKDKNKRFTPPTLEQVQEYCISRSNSVNAEQFIDHYTSNGWLIGGRSKMKDWKASVRNWERNTKNKNISVTKTANHIVDNSYQQKLGF
jgi:hypothetical protein